MSEFHGYGQERGEKGDHGQQGDEGHKGARGETGEQGVQGVQGKRGRDTRNPAVWALAFALVLCFTLLAISTHRNANAIKAGDRALCALKSNDQDSLKSTKRILKANPLGDVVIAGTHFTHKELLADEAKLEKHIAAYKDVPCS